MQEGCLQPAGEGVTGKVATADTGGAAGGGDLAFGIHQEQFGEVRHLLQLGVQQLRVGFQVMADAFGQFGELMPLTGGPILQ
ncbi:hypothetical protein D9M68_656750 [compost metagenome]